MRVRHAIDAFLALPAIVTVVGAIVALLVATVVSILVEPGFALVAPLILVALVGFAFLFATVMTLISAVVHFASKRIRRKRSPDQ
jgi:hypothetical protein